MDDSFQKLFDFIWGPDLTRGSSDYFHLNPALTKLSSLPSFNISMTFSPTTPSCISSYRLIQYKRFVPLTANKAHVRTDFWCTLSDSDHPAFVPVNASARALTVHPPTPVLSCCLMSTCSVLWIPCWPESEAPLTTTITTTIIRKVYHLVPLKVSHW